MLKLPEVTKTIALNIIGPILLVVVFGLGIWGVYHKVKSIGYEQATAECVKKFSDYQTQVDTRVQKLESSVKSFDETLQESTIALTNDINKILNSSKKQPTVVIKEGKCLPAPQFVDSLNEAINRVNKK